MIYRLPNGMTRVPWGFQQMPNGLLMPTESTASRFRRAELGESAIVLLERLGVSVEMLEQIAVAEDPMTKLAELQGAQS